MTKPFILTAPLLYYCDKLIIFLHDLKGTDESHLRHRLRNRDNLQFIEINPDEVRSILARNRDNLQFIEINPDEVRSIGEKQGQPSVYWNQPRWGEIYIGEKQGQPSVYWNQPRWSEIYIGEKRQTVSMRLTFYYFPSVNAYAVLLVLKPIRLWL